MDSITQVALGAAVGEAVLGKKVGYKAVLWGGAAGLIPDLDIIVMPFLDNVQRLTFHRGFSHSITFSVLLAPLFGLLIYKLYRGEEATKWDWTKLSFWALITHLLLDAFTSYGTQLFQPFSNYRVSFNSIFIIDPFYSAPLILSIFLLLFFKKGSKKRIFLNYIGLGFSSFYLIFTLVNKMYVNSVFEASLEKQAIPFTRFLTNPAPFTNILWMSVVDGTDAYWIGYYSLLDNSKDIVFQRIEKNHELIKHLKRDRTIQKLIYVSKGYYCIRRRDNSLYFIDLKFGTFGKWQGKEENFAFVYRIITTDEDQVSIQISRFSLGSLRDVFNRLLDRIMGI